LISVKVWETSDLSRDFHIVYSPVLLVE
jgi:hypothetical protein